ncbi:hypothetical protein BASA81_011573 [Batrachochytrium salamandrivorans]|nr:hypothetical protein BASA81_011573 [Batrachochytrium salamandrivorans]
MISQLVREHRNITTAVLDSLNIDTDMLHKTDTVYQAPTNLLPLDSIDHSSELQLAQALVALGYRVPPSSSSSTSSISAKERVRTASSLQRLPTPDTSQTVTELTHQQWHSSWTQPGRSWEYLQESGIDYPKSDMLLKDHFQDYPTHSTPKTDPTSRHIPNSNAVSDYLNPAQLEHNMSQLNDIEADSVRLERHLSTLISQRTFIK